MEEGGIVVMAPRHTDYVTAETGLRTHRAQMPRESLAWKHSEHGICSEEVLDQRGATV